jgi:ATP-dependent DNA helicase RecG
MPLQLPVPPRAESQTAAPDSLEGFLAAVAPPIEFLVTASATAAARTQLPSRTLVARGRSLLARLPGTAGREDLEALCTELAAFDTTPPTQRRERMQRCLELVQRLRRAAALPALAYEHTPHREEGFAALRQSVQYLRGVGPRRAEILRKFGLETVEDVLYHVPFRYDDRRTLTTVRALRVGTVASVVGHLTHLAERYVGRAQRRILEGVLRDDTGLLALTWFHQIGYFKTRFSVGQRCLVHGKVESGPTGQKRIVHPEVEVDPDLDGAGILPIYSKPAALSAGVMRKIVHDTFADFGRCLPSVLPAAIARHAHVSDLASAMRLIHLPQRDADVDALNGLRSLGHRSLVFDELFFLQLGMALRRRSVELETGVSLPRGGVLSTGLRAALPFTLTAAQGRVIAEILADMERPHPLHRLVQGDVGSGKTIVALFAAMVAIENGYQAAFMAPTELLAEQHYATIERFTTALGVRTVLLTGEAGRSQRKDIHRQISAGEVQLVVGTHALIQSAVAFKSLGLGVIDEQHRFGVLQRAALRRLGPAPGVMPDILLMTATPIPRTLAMAVYGDLELSVLDELPPGRQPVRTLLRNEGERAKVYDLVKRELDRGRQGYVVYPLVDDSDAVDLRAAATMAQELARTVFGDYTVGLLHGRMKAAEKDAVMRRFKAGDLQLLVSTTVIEVGIDVPNATVMVIEHAERFGLSQLHQLRGRVGRGDAAAVCILLTPYHRGAEALRRLQAMLQTSDGFRIAEADLEIRGPGEILGTRQSGLPDFRVANLIRDRGIMEEARQAADEWLRHDPQLQRPESASLRAVLVHRWAGRLELAEIG